MLPLFYTNNLQRVFYKKAKRMCVCVCCTRQDISSSKCERVCVCVSAVYLLKPSFGFPSLFTRNYATRTPSGNASPPLCTHQPRPPFEHDCPCQQQIFRKYLLVYSVAKCIFEILFDRNTATALVCHKSQQIHTHTHTHSNIIFICIFIYIYISI